MVWKCEKCKKWFEDDVLRQNRMCIDCFVEDWGKIIESPGGAIVSPRISEDVHDKEERDGIEKNIDVPIIEEIVRAINLNIPGIPVRKKTKKGDE